MVLPVAVQPVTLVMIEPPVAAMVRVCVEPSGTVSFADGVPGLVAVIVPLVSVPVPVPVVVSVSVRGTGAGSNVAVMSVERALGVTVHVWTVAVPVAAHPVTLVIEEPPVAVTVMDSVVPSINHQRIVLGLGFVAMKVPFVIVPVPLPRVDRRKDRASKETPTAREVVMASVQLGAIIWVVGEQSPPKAYRLTDDVESPVIVTAALAVMGRMHVTAAVAGDVCTHTATPSTKTDPLTTGAIVIVKVTAAGANVAVTV